jgi:serine protease DegQ
MRFLARRVDRQLTTLLRLPAAFHRLFHQSFMKRTWLLFAQAVTVLLAAYFVVATLKPEWLNKRSTSLGGVVSIVEPPAA